MYYIYKITNTKNNKCYIGFTSNPSRRWKDHKKAPHKRPLYESMRTHGKEFFAFEVIYQHEDREHVLNIMEPHFIELYEAYTKGYNCTRGGDDNNTVEMRERSSKRMKNDNPMSKLRVNSGSFQKGRSHTVTDDMKAKISAAKLGTKNPMYGNPHAADHLKQTRICDHCTKEVSWGNYVRWHGDKCKLYVHFDISIIRESKNLSSKK